MVLWIIYNFPPFTVIFPVLCHFIHLDPDHSYTKATRCISYIRNLRNKPYGMVQSEYRVLCEKTEKGQIHGHSMLLGTMG